MRAGAFGEIALLDRECGHDRRRTQQQVVVVEEREHALRQGDPLRFGPVDVVGRERQPLLDVPDHFGLEQIAMLAQHLSAADREGERTQHLEALVRFREIGMRLLDHDAGFGEAWPLPRA